MNYSTIITIIRVFFLFLPFCLSAQKGNLYLNNYTTSLPNIQHQYFDALQSADGKMFFANIYGILIYDGEHWKMIDLPSTPFSLFQSKNYDKIYVGGSKSIGYVLKSPSQEYSFHVLKDSTLVVGDVEEIASDGENTFFYSKYRIFVFNSSDSLDYMIKTPDNAIFDGFFIHQGKVFVNVLGVGLHEYENKRLTKVSGFDFLEKSSIVDAEDLGDNILLIATNNNELYKFDGKTVIPFTTSADDYIKGNIITEVLSFINENVVVSTLSGGSVIVNKNNGQLQHIINYQGGLPDDEVLATTKDKMGGLWICHENGITRVDALLPVENYSVFQGVEGNIYSVSLFNDILYVSSSEGVYYISKVERLEEVQDFIKKEHKQSTYTKRYKTFRRFKRLVNITFKDPNLDTTKFSDQKQYEYTIPVSFEVPIDSVSTSIQDVFTDQKFRKVYALQSIPYVFKKVKFLDAKCRQITEINNNLYVGSSLGLYQVINTYAQPVIKGIYVNQIYQSKIRKNLVFVAHSKGIVIMREENGQLRKVNELELNYSVNSIEETDSIVWLGAENNIIRFTYTSDNQMKHFMIKNIHNKFKEDIRVQKVQQQLLIFSYTGIYTYEGNQMMPLKSPELEYSTGSKIIYNQPGFSWINHNLKWKILNSQRDVESLNLFYLGLFQQVEDIFVDKENNFWIVDNNKIYKIVSGQGDLLNQPFALSVNGIVDKRNNKLETATLNLKFKNNEIKIDISSLFFIGEDFTQYQYTMKGLDEEWSEWDNNPEIEYPFLPSGKYMLQIRAKNVFDQVSNIVEIPVKVARPFWQSTWFYLLMLIFIGAASYFFIRLRTKRLEMANKILQEKIDEATKEIRSQKEELQKKNEHITGSIQYAQLIQNAILPIDDTIVSALPDSFILFKPRDIVSGDFYWFYNDNQRITLVAADCTGHGVPGAFMSMIGNTLLNQIVRENRITDPARILMELDREIMTSLKQNMEDSKTADGMDIAICSIDKNKRKIFFAGAMNPLLIVDVDKEPVVIEADKNPIGGNLKIKDGKKFTVKEVDINPSANYYIFSDGFIDQDGGKNGNKIKMERFQKVLMDIKNEPFAKQHEILNEKFENWKGDLPQRDDVLVIGFAFR